MFAGGCLAAAVFFVLGCGSGEAGEERGAGEGAQVAEAGEAGEATVTPISTGHLQGGDPNALVEARAEIVEPMDDEGVGYRVYLEGTFANVFRGDCLWAGITSPYGPAIYRQGPIVRGTAGTWYLDSLALGLGVPEEVGSTWVISVIFATERTCQAWRDEMPVDGYLKPIFELPPDCVILDSVSVTLLPE